MACFCLLAVLLQLFFVMDFPALYQQKYWVRTEAVVRTSQVECVGPEQWKTNIVFEYCPQQDDDDDGGHCVKKQWTYQACETEHCARMEMDRWVVNSTRVVLVDPKDYERYVFVPGGDGMVPVMAVVYTLVGLGVVASCVMACVSSVVLSVLRLFPLTENIEPSLNGLV